MSVPAMPERVCDRCGTVLEQIGPQFVTGIYLTVELGCPRRQRHALSVLIRGDQGHSHYHCGWVNGAWRQVDRIGWA